MEPAEVATEEPLPAPTGSRAMAMFLGQPAAAGPVQGSAPTADAKPRAASPAAQEHPQPSATQNRQQPPPAARQQPRDNKQQGMSKLDYETCVALQHILAKYKEADPFRQPVDVEALGIPDYLEIIKTPMDLKTVRQKLKAGEYKSMQEWRDDIQLIWDNAIKYNGEGHVVSNQALKLQQAVERRFDVAVEQAKAAMAAEARGEPRPRKSHKPRTTELMALTGGAAAASSDSDSLDELAAAAAAGGRRSPDSTKVAVKREREQQADASRPPKRRATSGAAAAGPAAAAGDRNLGLDPETLVGMLNTPMARQLGAEEPDDLGFLAMWKRLMTRKQQLAADAESARAASQQLRSTVSQLQDKLREEGAARQAAVAARAELEVKLQEAERKAEHWLTEFHNQKQIIESQRDLLEQQQQVLRKLAAQKQATMASEGRSGA